MAGTPRGPAGPDRVDKELIALWDDVEALRLRQGTGPAYVALKKARYAILEVLDAATEPPQRGTNPMEIPRNYEPHPTMEEVDRELREVTDDAVEGHVSVLNRQLTTGTRWEYLPLAQRRALRAENELYRRQRLAGQQGQAQTEQQAREAEREQLNQRRIDAYKAQLQGVFIGTSEDFERAWPDELRAWQMREARSALDANRARLLAQPTIPHDAG